MGLTKPLAQAITDLIVRKISTLAPVVLIGTWQGQESPDTNLSSVLSGGQTLRYVPKLSSTPSLSQGDQVLMVKAPGVPLTILGRVIGNIRSV